MRYNVQSASVLNEADRFQAILDWQLFTIDQNNMLWGGDPDLDVVEWRPGDSLHQNPRALDNDLYERLDRGADITEFDLWDGPAGNCVRPMFQAFDFMSRDEMIGWGPQTRTERSMVYPPVRCEPCGVSWDSTVSECWVCGTDYPVAKPLTLGKNPFEPLWVAHRSSGPVIGQVLDVETTDDGFVVSMQFNDEFRQMSNEVMRRLWEGLNEGMDAFARQMSAYMYSAGESLRGSMPRLFAFDEMQLYNAADVAWTQAQHVWLNRWIEPFHPPARTLSPFEREDVDLELVPIARYDPRLGPEPVSAELAWSLSSVDISWERPVPPVPNLTPIDLERFNTHRFSGVTINTPITEQRRRREV